MQLKEYADIIKGQATYIHDVISKFEGFQWDKKYLHTQIVACRKMLSELDNELKKYPYHDEDAAVWEAKRQEKRTREGW